MIENPENMLYFWCFVYERQMIYHRRFVLEHLPPWTEDPVLASHHFCNVYRELDRGTEYIIDILSQIEHGYDALWNILVYRYFNSIPAFEFLRDDKPYLLWDEPWNHREQAGYLKYWERNDHGQVFTSAFTVTGVKFGGYTDKISNVCFLMELIQHKVPDIVARLEEAENFEKAYRSFLGVSGYGRFLAFQVAVDWAYYDRRLDRNSFAEAGPGCINGLKWLYPTIKGTKAYHEAIHALADQQEAYFRDYGMLFPYWQGTRIVASDIENCLCEFSKYMKLRMGKKPDGSPVRGRGRVRRFDPFARIQTPLPI
jgi:hypothetical protein